VHREIERNLNLLKASVGGRPWKWIDVRRSVKGPEVKRRGKGRDHHLEFGVPSAEPEVRPIAKRLKNNGEGKRWCREFAGG
jgi:hypothetical protein